MPAPAETSTFNPRVSRRDFLGMAARSGALALAANYLPSLARQALPEPGLGDSISRAEAGPTDPYPLDYPLIPPGEENLHPGVPQGWFFRQQAQFEGKPDGMGYIVYNDTQNNIPLWKAYQDLGGKDIFGHAITNRWQTGDGKWTQLFANAGIQYDPATQRSEYVNALDMMARAGIKAKDTWYHIPDSRDGVWDPNLPEAKNKRNPEPGTLEANQIDAFFSPRFLPGVPPERIEALKAFFLSDPNWYTTLGLPTGNGVYTENGVITIITVGTQRGAVQMRVVPMPGSTLKSWEPFKLSGTQAYRDLVKDLGREDLIPLAALKAEYNPYGVGGQETETPQQAFNKKLQALLAYTTEENGIKYPNALGLNPQEVNRYIAGTLAEADIHSFKVLKKAKGDPLAILVTGGQYGLKKDQNIAIFLAAVKRLNEIDPDTFDQLTQGFGLGAITNEIAPGDIFTLHPTYGATFKKEGILLLNEKVQDFSITRALETILQESRGIYNRQNLVWNGSKWVINTSDKLHDNEGIEKGMWLRQWAEQHKSQLTPDEYTELVAWADINIKAYTDAAKNAA